jgi:hypothetical protein
MYTSPNRNSHQPSDIFCKSSKTPVLHFLSCIASSLYRNSHPPAVYCNAQRYFLQIYILYFPLISLHRSELTPNCYMTSLFLICQNLCLIFLSGIASSLNRNSHPLAICPAYFLFFQNLCLTFLSGIASQLYRNSHPTLLYAQLLKKTFQNLSLVM